MPDVRLDPRRRFRFAMTAFTVVASLVIVSLLAARYASEGGRDDAGSEVSMADREVLETYCIDCHNVVDREADLALDAVSASPIAENVATWERVVRKLRSGQMPPPASDRRPEPAAVESLVRALESRIDSMPGALAHTGRPLLGRLNRAEYGNAIRDLLGLDVDVSLLLPPDDAAYGFDNVADALGNSPALLQSYLTAARRIAAIAVGDRRIPPGSVVYSARQDLSQHSQIEGLPLGTIGGLASSHIFPVSGEYEFQVRLYRTNLSAMRGLEDPHQVELAVDGERILLAAIGGDDDLIALQTNPTLASDTLENERLRVRAFVAAGQRVITAAFLDETPALFDTTRLQPFERDFNPYDAEGPPHIQSIAVTGPIEIAPGPTPPGSTLFVCRPSPAVDEGECARDILTTVARRAYRRPVTEREIEELLTFFEQGSAEAGFESGIQLGLRRILASPSFVFLPEAESLSVEPGSQYPLDDHALATRLSLFLWSSVPDAELLSLADEGRLTDIDVLTAQVERMLDAPQASAFTQNFAGQWLHLRNLENIVPSSELYPDFDDNLRQSFRREAELFFASVLREDRSALDLLQSGQTFVNERLARHYGIDGIFGSDFRQVTLSDEARYGLLGKGAILLATSHPNTTSPVLRGKWVLENLIGAPPPPPPADLDTSLKAAEPGARPVTMRERMERHWEDPVCAQCHTVLDPIGFALESFDVTGAWRDVNDSGAVLDTSAVIYDGTEVQGVVDLRRALLQRPRVFVQTLTEKLMVYGLRRGLTYEDMPVVRDILDKAGAEDYRLAAIIREIVVSTPFRMRVSSGGAVDASEVIAVTPTTGVADGLVPGGPIR